MDSITFGSFPRSGNHFILELLKKTSPSLGVHWAQHNVAILTKKRKAFTTMRNPIECVTSWINYTQDNRPNRAEKTLEWYVYYYSQCLQNKIKILDFDELINSPIHCLQKVVPIQNEQFEIDIKENIHDPTIDKTNFGQIKIELLETPLAKEALQLFEAFKQTATTIGRHQ